MRILRNAARLLIIAAFALVSAKCASAQVTWHLSDITFSNGNTATGSFTTNSAVTAITNFSIVVSGPDTAADFTATAMSSAYLPTKIGIFDSPLLPYVDLFLTPNMLTGAGGTVPVSSGFNCPASGGCGTLLTGGHNDPAISTTPEPATGGLMILGLGLLMRKRIAQWVRRASAAATSQS